MEGEKKIWRKPISGLTWWNEDYMDIMTDLWEDLIKSEEVTNNFREWYEGDFGVIGDNVDLIWEW